MAGKPARALHVDLLVERAGLAAEVIVGCQVHDRGDLVAMPRAHPCEGFVDTLVRGHVHADGVRACRGQMARSTVVQADDVVASDQLLADGAPDSARTAGDDNGLSGGIHRGCSLHGTMEQTPRAGIRARMMGGVRRMRAPSANTGMRPICRGTRIAAQIR